MEINSLYLLNLAIGFLWNIANAEVWIEMQILLAADFTWPSILTDEVGITVGCVGQINWQESVMCGTSFWYEIITNASTSAQEIATAQSRIEDELIGTGVNGGTSSPATIELMAGVWHWLK